MNDSPPHPDPLIRRVDAADRAAAIAHLALHVGEADAAQAQRFIDVAEHAGLDLSHLWAAHEPDGRVGSAVVLVIPQTGRTGMVFASRPPHDDAIAQLTAVVRATCAALNGERFALAQALLDPTEQRQRDALDRAVGTVQGGMALLYSPEGHRSGHGRLQRARNGIALLASRANARLAPVALIGLEPFWPNLKRLRITRARIEVGRPFSFVAGPSDDEALPLREMTTQAMYRLARMLPERNRGAYADLSQASEDLLRFD